MILARSLRAFCRPRFTTSISSHTRNFTMAPITHHPKDTRPVIISGPSGVGKGTLWKMLKEAHPDVFQLSVSHTTRGPRPGEKHETDYYFTTMEEFEKLIAENGFVEHAKFGGNRYGTSKMALDKMRAEGKVAVLDIEMEGVKQIKAAGLDARYVFIAPPSFSDLEVRLKGRGTETEESIQKRLAQAKAELEFSKTEGVHDKIIVNDVVERAFKELDDFVFGN